MTLKCKNLLGIMNICLEHTYFSICRHRLERIPRKEQCALRCEQTKDRVETVLCSLTNTNFYPKKVNR
eukprot:UN18252